MERTERVLVVRRALLGDIIDGQNGLLLGNESRALEIILGNREFLPRPEAEENPNYKQIIPYTAVCRGESVFMLRRLSSGGESRLAGKLSLGVGGHITARDGNTDKIIARGLMRELTEEISLQNFYKLRLRGLINDDRDEVGRVHLGLFYTLETSGEIEVREIDKLEGSFVPVPELEGYLQEMESWSRLIVPALSDRMGR